MMRQEQLLNQLCCQLIIFPGQAEARLFSPGCINTERRQINLFPGQTLEEICQQARSRWQSGKGDLDLFRAESYTADRYFISGFDTRTLYQSVLDLPVSNTY